MATTLITAWEVIKYGPLPDNYPGANIKPHIQIQELTFRRKFLGDLYDTLLTAVVDYGKLNQWDKTKTYALEERILWDDMVFESLVANNTTNPCEDDGTNWKEADKFSVACYNQLWPYLRVCLAFMISPKGVRHNLYSISGKGATKYYNNDAGIRTIDLQEKREYQKDTLQDTTEAIENMKTFMRESTCDFSTAKFLKEESCVNKTDNYPRSFRRAYLKKKKW